MPSSSPKRLSGSLTEPGPVTPDPSALAGVRFTLPIYPTAASRIAAVGWLSRYPTPATTLSTEQRWLVPVQDVTVRLGRVDACPEAGPVAGRAAGPGLCWSATHARGNQVIRCH